MMAVSDALAEGVGAGAGRGMLRCEVPLELRTVETVAAAIGQGTAPGIKLPRKPPLGAEDAVSAIADRSGEGAFAPEARRGSQRNQAQSGGGDVERVCQVRCGEDVAQGGGEDGHGDYCGGEDVAADRRRKRRRRGRGGGTIIVPGVAMSLV